MPRVIFIGDAGDAVEAEGDPGQSVMELATRRGVEGIVGECGGCCACATCHVYVAEGWRGAVGAPSADEDDMLSLVFDRRAGSRLSCQIRMRAALDGLTVRTPARQA